MKIGLTIDAINLYKTGIGYYSYFLVREILLLDKINQYFLITPNQEKVFPSQRNVTYLYFPYPSFYKTYLWYNFLSFRLKPYHLDIIHNLSGIPTFLPLGQKNIITIHDISPILDRRFHTLDRRLFNQLSLRRTLIRVDKIITVSENTKKDLIGKFDLDDKKIEVIYHGSRPEFRLQSKRKLIQIKQKYHLKSPFILFVGTLEPRKNILRIIQAFKILKKKKIPHRLILIGKKGWGFESIFDLISQLKMKDQIISLGYLNDQELAGFYQMADVFVYPSLYEGFGLPVLEAIQLGCPVVTSKTSSLPEVAGHAALLIDPEKPAAIAQALERIITDQNLRQQLIQKGVKQVKKFAWSKAAHETIRVYKDLLKIN